MNLQNIIALVLVVIIIIWIVIRIFNQQAQLNELWTKFLRWLVENELLLLFLSVSTLIVLIDSISTFSGLKLKASMNLVELLGGTIVIIAVVERTVELFITTWRNPRKEELQRQIESIKNLDGKTIEPLTQEKRDDFITAHQTIKNLKKNDNQLSDDEKNQLNQAERKIEEIEKLFIRETLLDKKTRQLDKYVRQIQMYSLWLSLFFGVIAAIAGIRILEPLVDLGDFDKTDLQLKAFYRLDLVFSAIGISTGSQLFHIFPALVSDVLNGVRPQNNSNEKDKL